MYKLFIKPFLFLIPPERAHHFTFNFLKLLFSIPFTDKIVKSIFSVQHKEKIVAGINFKNPVGLAAGFDKDGKLFNELAAFGFGFIEVGTVTPKAQPGNEQPRLFRLPKDEALINRMGFNNEGADALARRLQNRKYKHIIIGGNIGKNKNTPNEKAIDDYVYCFNALHNVVDYFVVNVSSPNTPGLRALQDKEPLMNILNSLQSLNINYVNPKPVFLKIAPDLTNEQLDDIVEIVQLTKIAGVVATNTTINRSNLKTTNKEIEAIGAGGLSGKPVTTRSTEVIKYLSQKSNKSFAIIGVGGIHSAGDAADKLAAGADLVQLYTGFIYEGPGLVKKVLSLLNKGNVS